MGVPVGLPVHRDPVCRPGPLTRLAQTRDFRWERCGELGRIAPGSGASPCIEARLEQFEFVPQFGDCGLECSDAFRVRSR